MHAVGRANRYAFCWPLLRGVRLFGFLSFSVRSPHGHAQRHRSVSVQFAAGKSAIDLTPKQYLLARKLDGARRRLRLDRGGTSITRVAHDLGFVSASRLSEYFYRQFGESPSDMLRSLE